ncbi:olfactory receptor 2D2-like [Ambystoma mexicanum]|uniref:olfactory receptor 2D2-like n=1 Tax=Ambystoma mexicanum TaxID=8296 RepID=UPI0037E998F2
MSRPFFMHNVLLYPQISMEKNGSSAEGFLLVGLSDNPHLRIYLFLLFLAIYAATVIGNIILITVCICEPRLHTPMYFFLVNLSFLDICYSTVTVPNMLVQLLLAGRRISFLACATQMYSYLLLGCTECVLLAVMAYDRCVAISFPLRYVVIMRKSICVAIGACCWLSGMLTGMLVTVFTLQVPLCTSNVINHFFCEATALLKIACGDTFLAETVIFSAATVVLLIPSFVILFTYISIITTILGIRTDEGRYKTFSTCASHLVVVVLFYSTGIFLYMKPVSKNSANQEKLYSLFYTVTPPMLNPLIYSLRNQEVKMALQKIAKRHIAHSA